MPIVGKCITLCKPSHNCTICKFLWLKGQPHLCFCLHERVWLLYFIPSVSKLLWNNWLKIIKHTFMNTTDSKAIRFWASACNIHDFEKNDGGWPGSFSWHVDKYKAEPDSFISCLVTKCCWIRNHQEWFSASICRITKRLWSWSQSCCSRKSQRYLF